MDNDKNNEITPNGSGDLAVIGEGTPNEARVSIQVLQNIYHELTGKSEEVSKRYDEAFRVSFDDFEQLDYRVLQACEPYTICASNCSLKVYYVNDTQDTFSSFERFRAFNKGSASTVESVFIQYNFLIMLPKINKPQSYTLNIRVASRIAIEKKMREDIPFEMPKVLRLMNGRTAVVTVKYVDYVVARNILNVVDEWFKALPKSTPSKFWAVIRRRSEFLPLITRYITGALVAIIIYLALPSFVQTDASLLQFAKFWLGASIGLFAAYKLAEHLGRAAEVSVDNWNDLSYISLTQGDKSEIEEAINRNHKSIWLAILKFLGGMLVSLVAKVIVNLLLKE